MDNNDEHKIFWRLSSKEPIPIHLHPSLGLSLSTALSKTIKKYAGNPRATEDEAEVIICRKDGPMFSVLTKKHDHDRYKWVEPPLWIDACIAEKKYYHPVQPPVLKSRPGGRSQFTFAEDEHIVRFLARRIPSRTQKGRSGQSVWKDLCSRTNLYPWAARHSWQSWRERYVKNTAVFDDRIDAAVQADPDPQPVGGNGQYRVQYGKPGPRNRPQPNGISYRVEEEEEEEDEDEEIDIDGEIAKRKATSMATSVEIPAPKRCRTETGSTGRREQQEKMEEVETSRPGPSNKLPEQITPIAAPVASTTTLAPSFAPPERSISPSPLPSNSSSSPALPEINSSSRRRSNNTVVPVTSGPRTRSRSRPIVTDQTATVLDNNNDPPALRTRARSRQVSVEPPAQPVEQSGRMRRTRATASPVPPAPPPPTLATQPQTINFDQLDLHKRGTKKAVSKPALIPILETSENRLNFDGRRSGTSVYDTPRVQAKSKVTVVPDDDEDDDDDDDDDGDLGLISSDDASAMRSFNEGMRVITNQATETDSKEQTPTPQPQLTLFKHARKIANTVPLLHRKPVSNGSEDESEDESESSENEESGSGSQLSSHVDTETSVPAAGTNAQKFITSQKQFTPARGTLANERVEGHRWILRDRKVDKGKGRA